MTPIVRALLAFVTRFFRSRVSLPLEILALRHQLALYHRLIRRPFLRPGDRILWSWLARHWARWREALVFEQPATVLAWQRTRFRAPWALTSANILAHELRCQPLKAILMMECVQDGATHDAGTWRQSMAADPAGR